MISISHTEVAGVAHNGYIYDSVQWRLEDVPELGFILLLPLLLLLIIIIITTPSLIVSHHQIFSN